MKNLLIAVLLLTSLSSFSKNTNQGLVNYAATPGVSQIAAANVPAAVIASFNANFPGATRVKWQKESAIKYSVEFFIGAQQWKAAFVSDGTLIFSKMVKH